MKQAWHILQKDNSLLYRIWATIPQLKRGFLWRIGAETTIRVWSNQWIPGISTGSIRNLAENDWDMKVCELFDSIIGDWNTQLVHSFFPPNVTLAILKIKILPTHQPDKLA